MSPRSQEARKFYRTGIILSALAVLFLTFDTVVHILNIAVVRTTMEQLGYSLSVARPLGFLELVCLALYLIPRTAPLGAILLTGYLGGAVATHVRVDNPLFSHILFPTYIGLLLWAGLFLRDARLRPLLSAREQQAAF